MSRLWTKEEYDEMERLWAKGLNPIRIAIALDKTEYGVMRVARRNRAKFPPRPIKRNRLHRPAAERPQEPIVVPLSRPTIAADRVTRAGVTLPRVTFIDGPYRMEAAE